MQSPIARWETVVIPFDERMTQHIVIPFGQELPHPMKQPRCIASSAAKLQLLRITTISKASSSMSKSQAGPRLRVRLSAVSSKCSAIRDDFGVDVEMMIRKHQFPRVFPDKVLAEARDVAFLDEVEANRRRDFRGLPIVTIDGETARDFDDAVLVTERADGGFELQVHIADVAEYVGAGTDLDLEARLRGNQRLFP